jgi:hypothetical protein
MTIWTTANGSTVLETSRANQKQRLPETSRLSEHSRSAQRKSLRYIRRWRGHNSWWWIWWRIQYSQSSASSTIPCGSVQAVHTGWWKQISSVVQCNKWNYVGRLKQPSLATTLPHPESDRTRLPITALSITQRLRTIATVLRHKCARIVLRHPSVLSEHSVHTNT